MRNNGRNDRVNGDEFYETDFVVRRDISRAHNIQRICVTERGVGDRGSTESVRRPSETKTELLLLDTKGAFVVGMPVSIRTPSTSSRGKLSTLGTVPVPFASPAARLTRYAPLGTAISHTRGGYNFSCG